MQRWQKQNPEPRNREQELEIGAKGAAEKPGQTKPDFAFEAAATKATKTC